MDTIRTMFRFILKYVSSPITSFRNNWFLCDLLIARIIVIMLLMVTCYELAMDSLKRGLRCLCMADTIECVTQSS